MQELERQHAPGIDEGWHRSPMSGSVRKKADGPLVLLSGHQLSLTVRLVTSRLKVIRAKGYNPAAMRPYRAPAAPSSQRKVGCVEGLIPS